MKSRFLVLDSFRGLAAICVVVHHMHFSNSVTETTFFRGSFMFVHFFFVLSGFVLAHSYGDATKSAFPLFVKKRFLRLYPLHFFTLLGFVSVELFRLAVEYFANYQFNIPPFSGAQATEEILPSLLLLQSWLPFANPYSFNAPSWSISVEFYLYILLFLSVAYGARGKVGLWLVFVLVAFYLTITGSDFSAEVLHGLRGFFGGALVYALFLFLKNSGLEQWFKGSLARAFMTLVEVTLLVLIVNEADSTLDFDILQTLLLFFTTVLVFAFEAGGLSYFLKHYVFQYLGRISYSIYLTHSLVLLFINLCLISIQMMFDGVKVTYVEESVRYITSGSVWINNVLVVGLLVLIIGVSHLSYRHIELRWQLKK